MAPARYPQSGHVTALVALEAQTRVQNYSWVIHLTQEARFVHEREGGGRPQRDRTLPFVGRQEENAALIPRADRQFAHKPAACAKCLQRYHAQLPDELNSCIL
jgi:hypothetical protein